MGTDRSLSGVSVLVVEDHAHHLDAMRTFLHQSGATVFTASNGVEALAVLAVKPLPDVILSDVQMPYMDGCELVAQLREKREFRRVPIIALTGQSSDVAMLRALEVGFDAFLVKPISADALTTQILRVLGRQ
jgi:CheY-like chemotaxis protein